LHACTANHSAIYTVPVDMHALTVSSCCDSSSGVIVIQCEHVSACSVQLCMCSAHAHTAVSCTTAAAHIVVASSSDNSVEVIQ
jgi:hypothetical protein